MAKMPCEYDEKPISAENVSLGTVTIGSNGYLDITSYKPTPPSGKTLLFVGIRSFGTATGAIAVTTTGNYLMGAPNTSITNLYLQYFYQ